MTNDNRKYCKSCGCYIPDNYTSCPACGKTEEDVWFEENTRKINENWLNVRNASIQSGICYERR